MIHTIIRATTPARLPPLALAAAAALHLVVGATALAAWQSVPSDDEPRPLEIVIVIPAAAPEPEPTPEPPAEPVAAAAEPKIVAFDPAFLPEPEPPPPLVFEQPKPPSPKPVPPRPAATPRPVPAIAATAPPAPAVSAPAATPAAAAAAPRPDPSYLDRLAAAIEREHDYPMHARRQGNHGRVVVQLVIAASGKLLAAQVITGSGLDTLDRAALGMVQRARLPPLGPGFGAESATFTIPIVFAMR